ncbi:secreted RxLR effector protein 161-like [Helianthus annuus]|uniref:secreted RxLR effector protein 161-like n=1 Tax=Helianthus annuus TaxID=4232 RepID=UPI001652D763|nr:secreted RxLR effector protein 161-like [Helianthus annuus]
MENSKNGGVPLTKETVLNKSQSPSTDIEIKQMEVVPYASAIGSIIKNILTYLRRTKDMFLVFGGVEEELTVRCYTDADFQSDRDDSRSQLGFVFTLNGGAVYWKSSKQSVVADSATESECIFASDAAEESAWMK